MEDEKKQALRLGTNIILFLLALTVVDFFIGAYLKIWWAGIILLIVSTTKSVFVVRDYMHVRRLFVGEEERH
jgi:predicted membrane protein